MIFDCSVDLSTQEPVLNEILSFKIILFIFASQSTSYLEEICGFPPMMSLWINCFLMSLHLCKVLRYVGVVDVVKQKGGVKLQAYSKDHPFAQLSGSDNIIAFTTTRYRDQPLIVRGPGAGAEVTAGGVFSDILRLASYLGAPS